MTPKEKAKELVFKKFGCSKMYALIAVDELLEFENRIIEEWERYFEGKGGAMKVERVFWQEVKQEIKKI